MGDELVGEWNRGLSMLGRLMDQNPYYPTWMHLVPYLDSYRKGEFATALEHANKYYIPSLAWGPIRRAAALGQIDRPKEADTAVKQLISNFPKLLPTRLTTCEATCLQTPVAKARRDSHPMRKRQLAKVRRCTRPIAFRHYSNSRRLHRPHSVAERAKSRRSFRPLRIRQV